MFRLLSNSTNAVIILAGVLVFLLSQWGRVTESAQWKTVDWALIDRRYQLRGERPADTNIILIGVETSSFSLDELAPSEIATSPTLQLMAKPLPWNRAIFAAAVDKLMRAGAKVVVLDYVFTPSGPGDDEFAEVLKKYRGHVVIASMFELTEQKLTPPTEQLLDAATETGVGLAGTFPDADGVTRRGIYRTSQARLKPSLSKFADQYPDDLISLSARAVEKFQGSVHTPPYGRDNFIDFEGGEGTYQPLALEDIFVDKLWNAPPINGGTTFSNKIVIVGPLANIYHDIHVTPFGEMPGPELQAQMMATLLHRSSLIESSRNFNRWVTLALLALALAICIFVHNALLKPVLLFLTTIGFLIICQFSFTRDGVVVDMMPPLFCLVSTGSFGIVFQYVLEQFERRRYRNVLDRYVSKSVANFILDDKRSFEDSLSGRKQSLTVLFTDIRSFTSWSEHTDPDHLVKQLNEYFLEMAGAVLKENGTLQKFIGDAIMAAWGDVHTEGPEEDARRAVRTSLAMRAALAKLNARWQGQPNRKPLYIGMGINEGEMIVGNIGHPQRMEFTVLGDGVNMAARLEGATKQFGNDLLVGESVEALTRKHFVFRRVGLLTLKGKSRPVEAFDVLSESSQQPPLWLNRYHEAIKLFRSRQFESARDIFREVSKELNDRDFLCQMYVEYCTAFLQNPPAADWNGTIVLTEK